MISRRILVWSVVFTATNSLVKLLQAAMVMVGAAVLAPSSYATFGILYALLSAMGTFAGTGLTEFAIGKLPTHRSQMRRLALFRRVSGVFAMTASLVFLAMSLLALLIPHETELALPSVLALALGGLIAFGTLQSALMRLEGRHAASLYAGPLVNFGGVAGVLATMALGAQLAGMFGAGLVAAGLILLALLHKGHVLLGPFPKLPVASKIARAIAPFWVIGILGWLTGYGMTFVINVQLNSSQVANFTFLFTLASLAQLVASSMNMAWSPHYFSIYHADPTEANRQSGRFFVLEAAVLALLSVMAIWGLPIVSNAIGGNLSAYRNLGLELSLLFAGYLFCIPLWHTQNLYLIENRGRALMTVSVWSGAIGLAAWIACIALWNGIGVYLGFAVQTAIKSVAAMTLTRAAWRSRPSITAILLFAALVLAASQFPQ